MNFNPPAKVRAAVYVITALSAPVVAYLLDQGHIHQAEVNLWAGIITAVNVMAGLNTAGK